jgi:hypothetical protein
MQEIDRSEFELFRATSPSETELGQPSDRYTRQKGKEDEILTYVTSSIGISRRGKMTLSFPNDTPIYSHVKRSVTPINDPTLARGTHGPRCSPR